MAGVIDSFLVQLGFQVDGAKLEEFQKKTEGLRTSILAVSAIATVAAAALGAMVMSVAKGMDDVGDFADIVGMSAREVAALGKVASMNDSSMDAMKSSIQGIANVTGQAALGIGRGAKIFETLGFEAKNAEGGVKGAYDILGEVADRMKGMSAGEKLALASKMGIDSSLIPLLSKGSEAFRKLKEEAEAANPLTEEQYKQADKIVKLWDKAAAGAGIFTKMLVAKLFPVMERVLTYWNDLFKAGRKATGGMLSAGIDLFVASLVTLWDWMERIVDAVEGVFKWLTQFKMVTWAAGAAIAVLIAYQAGLFFISLAAMIAKAATALFTFSAAGMLPVVILGALVLAIGLLVDDLINFYEGNESVIGQLNDEYPGAVHALEAALVLVSAGLVAMKWNAISSFATMLAGAVTTAVGWVASFAAMAVATLAATWPLLLVIAAVSAVGYAIYELWANWDTVVAYLGESWDGFCTAFMEKINSAIDFVTGLFDAAKENVMGFIGTITGAIGKVGELLGLSGGSVNVSAAAAQAPAMQGSSAVAQGGVPAMGGGVIGKSADASNGASNATTSNTTTISGTVINITSPDAAGAGESVRTALSNQSKQSIRNGQSATAL